MKNYHNNKMHSKYSFDTTVSLLSIAGFYLKDYIENPKLEEYTILCRVKGDSNGIVGTINRTSVIIFSNEEDSKSKAIYKKSLLNAISYFKEHKKKKEKPMRELCYNLLEFPKIRTA